MPQIIILLLTIILFFAAGMREGVLFWGGIALLISLGRGNSFFNKHLLFDDNKLSIKVVIISCIATILVVTLPMSLSPAYNGELPGHEEYELLADSILQGKIYLDYDDVDPRLLEMDNPYDPDARIEAGVSFHWDHAFYKGKYYMYFGVVPVILLYIPFRVLTGTSLLSYHATQFFSGAIIIGLYALFYMLAKKYFRQTKLGVFVYLATAFSIISVFDCIQAPAMYCTAISSAICMMVWSFYFFAKAVLIEENSKRQVVFAAIGALFGALAFGCRPSTALGNLCVIPFAIIYALNYIRNNRENGRKGIFGLIRNFCIVLVPYIIVAAGLMYYNYVRFDSPFEFGQSYQLTMADQTQYGNMLSSFNLIETINAILWNYIYYSPISSDFPYFDQGGFLVSYPVFWVVSAVFIIVFATKAIKEKALGRAVIWMSAVTVIITIMINAWTPYMSKRYRLDIYYILVIIGYVVFMIYERQLSDTARKHFYTIVCMSCVVSVVLAMFMFLVPFDYDFAEYHPEIVDKIEEVLMLR